MSEGRHRVQMHQFGSLESRVKFLEAEHEALVILARWHQSGFWARLRWIVRGWR